MQPDDQPAAPEQPAANRKINLADLAARLGVAVVAIPILLVVMYLDDPTWTWALVFVASLLCIHEFIAMASDDRVDQLATVAIGGAASALLYWLPAHREPAMVALFVAVVPTAIYYVLRFGQMETAASRASTSIVAILYGGLLFSFVALIKRSGGSGDWILLILLVPWISDTTAYFAGRFLGKRKMYPALSPGKTWAGAAGGLAGACLAAAFVKLFRIEAIAWLDVAVLGVIGGVLCQLGDLFESMVKRSCGVKDSGTLLPGHGGLLDRLDAVIVFAPFVYVYFTLFG